MIITLTGFMGVGKSTIATSLSKHLYCKLIDLDNYIVEKEGARSVQQLFELSGEQFFRKKEEEALVSIFKENREKVLIISLGGGTLISQNNRELIKEKSFCIYLRASLKTLIERLERSHRERPLLHFKEQHRFEEVIVDLFKIREPGYQECASLVIDIDTLRVNDILKQIISSI